MKNAKVIILAAGLFVCQAQATSVDLTRFAMRHANQSGARYQHRTADEEIDETLSSIRRQRATMEQRHQHGLGRRDVLAADLAEFQEQATSVDLTRFAMRHANQSGSRYQHRTTDEEVYEALSSIRRPRAITDPRHQCDLISGDIIEAGTAGFRVQATTTDLARYVMWLQYANKERKTPLDVTSDEEIREAWLFVCKAQETTDQMPLDIPSDEDVREKRLLARQAQATTEDFTRFVMRCVDQSRPRHQHRTDDEEVIEKWLFVRRLQATTGLEHLDTPNDGDVSEKRLSECRAQATMDSRSLDVPSDEEVIEMWRYVLRAHATSVDITRLVMQCANQEEQRRQRRTIDEDGRDALMFKFRSDATTTTRVPASIVMLRANQGVPSRKEVHDTQKYIAYKAHRRLLEQERSQDGVTINILHNNCGEHRSSRDHVRCEQCMPIDVWSVASMICEERPVASLKEVRQNIHCAPFANTGYVWLTGAELLDGVHVQLMGRVGDGLVRCVASPDIRSLNLIFYALLGTLSMEDLKRKSSRGERLQ